MRNLFKLLPLILASLLIMFSFVGNKKGVVIDAAHGGTDLGATYDTYLEKNIVLSIASKIKQYNKDTDTEIILTRDADIFPSLSERTDLVNREQPKMFISLHVNRTMRNDGSKTGPEIYYSEKNKHSEQSKILAEKLAQKIGTSKVKSQDFYVLRNTNVPAIMVEIGYIDNDKDRENMTSENGQNEIAKQILEFIKEN